MYFILKCIQLSISSLPNILSNLHCYSLWLDDV